MSINKRNNIHNFGQGAQPMLFAHGYGCDQHMWRLVTPAFADEYNIVLIDHVGAGKSDLTAYDPVKYNRADLSKLKTPALILQCRQDVIAPDTIGPYMQKQLPDSRLTVLNATGHWSSP